MLDAKAFDAARLKQSILKAAFEGRTRAARPGGRTRGRATRASRHRSTCEACKSSARQKVQPMNSQSLVAKVWNFAHVLRDQGVSYQAYIGQISYLLFLKMDEERVTLIGETSSCWRARLGRHRGPRRSRRGVAEILEKLSQALRHRRAIFLKARNEIQDPAKLKRLVGLIDGETWLGLPRRREGHDLRGPPRAQCAGRQVGRGAIFHAAPADRGDGEVVDPSRMRPSTTLPAAPAAFSRRLGAHGRSRWRATAGSIRR